MTLYVRKDASSYTVARLVGLAGTRRRASTKAGRTDDELIAKLETSRVKGQWHNAMLEAIATMIGRGWDDVAIKLACAPYCKDAFGDKDLVPLIEDGRKKWNKPNVDRSRIAVLAGQLHALASRSEQILLEAKVQIFERSNSLVRPIVSEVEAAHGRRTKTAALARVEPPYLRDVLSRHAEFGRTTKDKFKPCDPPYEVVATILARAGEFPFPKVAGVITTPTMRPDGTLLTEPGYDLATRLLLVEPPLLPSIPKAPSRDDALVALALLEGLLTEFSLVDGVARSVALSAFITPVVRGAFPVAPMHAARAPVAGGGKSYLWDTAAAICTGRLMPVMAAGRTEEETEKRLGAALMAGQPLISIDNVNGELGGDALCQIVERPVVEIRILGKSEQVRIEARGTTIFCTGNNIILKGDLTRRVVTATLDPEMERPELREFSGDPVRTVLANRGDYIAAALIICRAYFVAGRPNPVRRLASFEGWSDVVRSALIWLGRDDPIASMEAARDEDPILLGLREMLLAWGEVVGVGYEHRITLQDFIRHVNETDGNRQPIWPRLHAAAKTVAGSRQGQVDMKQLSYWTRRYKGRIVDGLRLKGGANSAKKVNDWWVERDDKRSVPGDLATPPF